MTAYVENFTDALPAKERIEEVRKQLEAAGVKYVLSSWIDLHGIPKTKPVPMSDFEPLCMGK
ncbi:MAG: glutamine synthetase, partial [Gammaproteobacteria bacterium]|nr:glutamine synthetase [Gammaproteobacteria bacterium]